ncbi:MAG: NifB/NifX family molybdenum-iron cluster-binding protein [Sulfurimicrobium sp.]
MKIAVTSQNRKTITGHAGKCRKFWIYDIEDKKIVNKTLLELALEQSFHESHGAGQGLIRRLNNMGIQGFVTQETDPDAAVAAYLDGTLKPGQSECHDGHEGYGEHHHAHH